MIKNSKNEVFERIFKKCKNRSFYGSDVDYIGMKRFAMRIGDREESVEEFWYDNNGNEHKVSQREQISRYRIQENKYALLRTGFAYRPATEEQLHATEDALGFLLPEVLHALYAQIANGGFGPGHGIIGVQGGFPNPGEDTGKDIVDVYHKRKEYLRLVDLVLDEEHLGREKKLLLPWGMFPASFLLLCDDGCGMKTYIDVSTNQIFQEYIDSVQYCGISLKASSLQEWLEAWLIKS